MSRIKVYYTDRPAEDLSFLEIDSLSISGPGGVQGLSVFNGVLNAQHIILKYATAAEWLAEVPDPDIVPDAVNITELASIENEIPEPATNDL